MNDTVTKTTPEATANPIAISATVSAQALRNAVTTIHRNCERGTWHASPILGCINLRMKKGKMSVAKYGNDLQISTEIEATGTGDIAIPARPLAAFLSAVDGDTVEIVKPADKGAVTLSCGVWSVSIITMNPADAPEWTDLPEPARSFGLAEGVLKWLFAMTAPFVSTEETRYYLCGVCFEIDNGRVRVIATDGHRLGTREASVTAPLSIWSLRPIVPYPAITALQNIVAEKEVSVSFVTGQRKASRGPEMETRATHAIFKAGGFSIATKLIDGTFPDWRRVVPSAEGRETVDIDVKKVGQFAKISSGFKEIGFRSTSVSIAPAQGGIRLESTIEGQTISGNVAGDKTGDFEQFGVNVRYLKELAASFGTKIVKAKPDGAGGPIIFTAPDSPEGELAILMPMRV